MRKLQLVLVAGLASALTALATVVGMAEAEPAVVPSNTEAPGSSAPPRTAICSSAKDGEWSGTDPMTFTYQWQSCDGARRELRQHQRRHRQGLPGGDLGCRQAASRAGDREEHAPARTPRRRSGELGRHPSDGRDAPRGRPLLDPGHEREEPFSPRDLGRRVRPERSALAAGVHGPLPRDRHARLRRARRDRARHGRPARLDHRSRRSSRRTSTGWRRSSSSRPRASGSSAAARWSCSSAPARKATTSLPGSRPRRLVRVRTARPSS